MLKINYIEKSIRSIFFS